VNQRAYSLLTLKSVDEDQRLIEGTASTPEVDRVGDVIESAGAVFKLPMPLLWQHKPDQPIGHVLSATVTKSGIKIRAQIAKNIGLPEIDRAWTLIKAGLVRGLSIGFKALEMEPLNPKDPWGGQRFLKWEWLELSAVTIPANQDASIAFIKSVSASALSGADARRSTSSPADVGRCTQKDARMTPNISEQVTAAIAELTTKSARLDELDTREGADGTLEADELHERDALTETVTALTGKVTRLKAKEAAQAALARPVYAKAADVDVRDTSRQNVSRVEVKSNLEPGIEFARYIICRMAALKHGVSALELAKTHYPDNPRIQWLIKDNIAAGSTQDNLFAKPLVNVTPSSEFVDWLRPQTLLGRIPGLTSVPFNTRITGQNSGATGYWVGEGKAKPLTRFGTFSTNLYWAKVAAIISITDELARFSSPSAEQMVRREIARALQERMDIDFVDPSKAAVANVSPASITNGVTNLNDSGTSLANVTTDIAQFFNAMIGNNLNVAECVWIMPNTVALQLSLMRDSLGALAFPTINVSGGTWQGIPVITSQYLLFSHTPANNKVLLVHAPSVALADDGGFTVDISREASLEMDDQPVMETGALGSPSGPTGSALVSMFQTNSMAIRCERYINWAKLRSTAVVWMDDVRWAA